MVIKSVCAPVDIFSSYSRLALLTKVCDWFSAEGGMGKSTEMKHLAISWADGTSKEMKKFDFVFHISLKFVKDDSPIENIIIAQHSSLKRKKVKPCEIRSILENDISKSVLILMDGHDEYKTGCNADIDDTIKKELLGECWAVLTSRETIDLNNLKAYMDAEVQILGFSKSSVERYIGLFMEDEIKRRELLKKAEEKNIKESILNVPILLNMVYSLFEGIDSTLPETRTEIIGCMVQRCINREAIRSKGHKQIKKQTAVFNMENWPEEVRDVFLRLCKFAWKKLREPEMKHFFEKVNPVFVKSVKLLLAASCLNPLD